MFPHFSNLTLGNVYFWKIIALFRAKGEQNKLSFINTALFLSQILPLFPTNNFLGSCGTRNMNLVLFDEGSLTVHCIIAAILNPIKRIQ